MRYSGQTDQTVGGGQEAQRLELARLYAQELADAYEGARLSLTAPVVLIVEAKDTLGFQLLDLWRPKAKRWLRRARSLQSGAFQPEFQLLVKELEVVGQFLEQAGLGKSLFALAPGHLCVTIIAFEGVSFCDVDLDR